jgi:hypothetical protein
MSAEFVNKEETKGADGTDLITFSFEQKVCCLPCERRALHA